MPVPLIAGAALAAGTQIASQLPNAAMAHFTNVKNRKFAREQYKTQRADALADWATANEYNSPRAQMQRFREAGLNPNLIYGQMQDASPVRSSQMQGATAQSPEFKIDNPYMSAVEASQRNSQTDLTTAQVTLIEDQRKLIQANARASLASAGYSDARVTELLQNMGFEREMFPLKKEGLVQSIEHTKANVDNLKATTSRTYQEIEKTKEDIKKVIADTKYTIDQNKRSWSLHRGHVALQALEIITKQIDQSKSVAEIDNLKQSLLILKNETAVKELEAETSRAGIRPGDPAWFKILQGVANKFRSTLGQSNPYQPKQ